MASCLQFELAATYCTMVYISVMFVKVKILPAVVNQNTEDSVSLKKNT